MAREIVEMVELYDEREGRESYEAAGREFKRAFRLRLSGDTQGPKLLFDFAGDKAALLPRLGDAYEETDRDGGVFRRQEDARCVAREVRQVPDGHGIVDVVCAYSKDYNPDLENPITRRCRAEYGQEPYDVGVREDVNGLLVANAVGDPFNDVTRKEAFIRLVVYKNRLVLNRNDMRRWRYRTNNAVWFGEQPGSVLHETCTATPERVNGISYWKFAHRFLLTDRTGLWKTRLLNAGFRARRSPDGAIGPITPNGVPITEPRLLKLDGTQYTDAEINAVDGEGRRTFKPDWLEFTLFGSLNFGEFDIDNIDLPVV